MALTPTRKIVVFSGGSAANSLVDVFNEVIENNSCSLSYVLPTSDNGGSSSELIRVFGGPGIGDIRSKVIPQQVGFFISCFFVLGYFQCLGFSYTSLFYFDKSQ